MSFWGFVRETQYDSKIVVSEGSKVLAIKLPSVTKHRIFNLKIFHANLGLKIFSFTKIKYLTWGRHWTWAANRVPHVSVWQGRCQSQARGRRWLEAADLSCRDRGHQLNMNCVCIILTRPPSHCLNWIFYISSLLCSSDWTGSIQLSEAAVVTSGGRRGGGREVIFRHIFKCRAVKCRSPDEISFLQSAVCTSLFTLS